MDESGFISAFGSAASGAGAGSFLGPPGALVGAGLGFVGGLMNTSSQQATNTAMLNAQGMQDLYGLQWRAGDATAAEKATGINRLALLGVPTASGVPHLVSPDSGQGAMAAGRSLMTAFKDPHEVAMDRLNEARSAAEVELMQSNAINSRIQGALQEFTLDKLRSDHNARPSGVEYPAGYEWFKKLNEWAVSRGLDKDPTALGRGAFTPNWETGAWLRDRLGNFYR